MANGALRSINPIELDWAIWKAQTLALQGGFCN
jgi:hypothetical protein